MQTSVVRLTERVKQVAYTVSVLCVLSLLMVATVVLGESLGGGVISFLVALALVGALSVLVLFVVLTAGQQVRLGNTAAERQTVVQRDSSVVQRDPLAA